MCDINQTFFVYLIVNLHPDRVDILESIMTTNSL